MATLEEMRAKVQQKFKEPIDVDETNDNINEAIGSLWASLILVNPGEYLARRPVKLSDDDAILPYDEIISSEGFIEHYCLTHAALAVYEYDSSSAWEKHSEELRMAAIMEAKANMPRQTNITPYRPSGPGILRS
jgi:hypothetical protein